MKVAITGCTGFIGRHLLKELRKRSIDVIALSRTPIESGPGITHIPTDLLAAQPLEYEQIGSPDILIHAAWGDISNVRSFAHLERELPAHFRFLKSLITTGLPALTVTGTCLEYGMQYGPLNEAMPTAPNTPYGLAKDSLRKELESLRTAFAFKYVWGRIFYLWGEGQGAKSIFPQLRSAVERGDPSFNMSGGEQLRDYLPVETVARKLVELATKADDVGVINICSGNPISLRRMVLTWIEQNGWNIDLNLGHFPYLEYEPMAFWGDRKKLSAFAPV